MNPVRQILLVVATVAVAVAGCAQGGSQQGDTPAATCGAALTDPAPASGSSSTRLGSTSSQVTFYGDIFPILDSVSQGAVYKCTTCHGNYKTPDAISSVTEIGRVISSMETKYMPRGGDPVPAAKIQIFRDWQLQGFAPGVPGQRPSTIQTTVKATGSKSGGCGN